MGGNALKEFGSKRLPSDRFQDFSNNFECALNLVLENAGIHEHKARMVKSYHDKDSHGDIDVLLPSTLRTRLTDQKIGQELSRLLGTSEMPYKTNGGVVSYGIPLEEGGVFQADLIYLPEYELDFALAYMSYNDVGNLVGRIAHKMGLTFGHNGLFMRLRTNETHMFDTLLVTRDFEVAVRFLGFDYERWSQGFRNLEEIFDFTVNNKRFSSSIYLLENRNHTARVRDKKRPTYTAFLKWLAEHPEKDIAFEWPEDKSVWLQEIFAAFPDLEKDYALAHEKLKRLELIKIKYNGERITNLTGLVTKDLGQFIQAHHASFESKVAFNDWVHDTEQNDIDSAIVAFSKRV